jgi:hypothetical protein
MRILALNQPSLNAAARHAAVNHQPNFHGASTSTDMYGPSAWEQRQVNRLRELGFAAYREQAGIREDDETREFNELVAEYKRNMVWCRKRGICLREGFVAKVMKMDRKKGMQEKKQQQNGVNGGRVEKKVKRNTDKKSGYGLSADGRNGVVMGSLVIRTKKED